MYILKNNFIIQRILLFILYSSVEERGSKEEGEGRNIIIRIPYIAPETSD